VSSVRREAPGAVHPDRPDQTSASAEADDESAISDPAVDDSGLLTEVWQPHRHQLAVVLIRPERWNALARAWRILGDKVGQHGTSRDRRVVGRVAPVFESDWLVVEEGMWPARHITDCHYPGYRFPHSAPSYPSVVGHGVAVTLSTSKVIMYHRGVWCIVQVADTSRG